MNQKPERKFYLQHFKAITHAISTYEDLNVLTNHLAEGTSRRFKAKGCSIMILDEDIDSLCVLSEQLGLVIENNGLKNFLDGIKIALGSLPPRLLKDL